MSLSFIRIICFREIGVKDNYFRIFISVLLNDNNIIDHYNVCFISGLDDEEDFSCPPALETIEVQQQQVLIRIFYFDRNS